MRLDETHTRVPIHRHIHRTKDSAKKKTMRKPMNRDADEEKLTHLLVLICRRLSL